MERTKACVKIGNDLTDHFEVNRRLEKRDWLASLLFGMTSEYVVRELTVDTNSSPIYKSSQIIGYSDDKTLWEDLCRQVKRCVES
jgi:hypothetical protein